ncbi:MAG TPA: hypothetical protein VFL88_07550 [Gemmatimonadales bacterium]|nr:hypothetical protein [Gemmatimonadales bacterium]
MLAATVLALVSACSKGSPLPSEYHGGLVLDEALNSAQDVANPNPELAAQLVELKEFSVKYHSLSTAQGDYPVLFVVPELTNPDGCISDRTMGGMGYHYAGKFPIDDHVNYLEPELLVFAPNNGPHNSPDGATRSRFAGFDYFVPYSMVWPENGTPPTSADLGLAIEPAIPFQKSRFGGWMFHIWLWAHNPDGMFANWNSAVPLCPNSVY